MRLNVKKTKVMLSGKSFGETDKGSKWLCVLCGKVIECNFIQYISCHNQT